MALHIKLYAQISFIILNDCKTSGAKNVWLLVKIQQMYHGSGEGGVDKEDKLSKLTSSTIRKPRWMPSITCHKMSLNWLARQNVEKLLSNTLSGALIDSSRFSWTISNSRLVLSFVFNPHSPSPSNPPSPLGKTLLPAASFHDRPRPLVWQRCRIAQIPYSSPESRTKLNP